MSGNSRLTSILPIAALLEVASTDSPVPDCLAHTCENPAPRPAVCAFNFSCIAAVVFQWGDAQTHHFKQPQQEPPTMTYAVRLYTVDSIRVPEFVAAFRENGLWTEIARIHPGYVHTDLLRNPFEPSRFLSIEFWTSIRALLAAQQSPEVPLILRWLRRLSVTVEDLGTFEFPPQPGGAGPGPAGMTIASGSRIPGEADPWPHCSETEIRS